MAPSLEQTPLLVPTAPKFTVDHHGKHATYVGELSRKYAALSQHFREEPPSPPRFLNAGQEERIRALRQRIQDAWVNADGNPADGKWASVTNLVRMGSISGRNGRWVGTRKDLPLAPEPERGTLWVNPKSEVEWKEWEKKYHEGLKVKDKVENWKKHLETVSPTVPKDINHKITNATRATTSSKSANPTSSAIQSHPAPMATSLVAKASSTAISDPLQEPNPLGFRVVKRASQTTTANGKPQPPPSTSKPRLPSRQQILPAAPAKHIQDVSDITDLSFMPPASPASYFATSTPKPSKAPQTKDEPATSSPLPSLTPSPRLSQRINNERNDHPRPRVSSSLPVVPTANQKKFTDSSNMKGVVIADQINANKKRPLPDLQSLPTGGNSSGRQTKKLKTSSEDEVAFTLRKPTTSVSPELVQPQSPTTPTQRKRALSRGASNALPKLTDLLASAQSPKRSNISKMKRAASPKKPAPEKKLHEIPEIVEDGFTGFNPYVIDPFASRPPGLNGRIVDERDSSPNMPLAVDDNLNVDEELLANVNQLEYDLASPSKSLSSLAGSEEDELSDDDALPTAAGPAGNFDFNLDSSFRPLATSTQVPRGPFVSKANLKTTSQQMSQQNGETSNVVDSWESVYASAKPSSNGKASAPMLPSSATSSTNVFLPSSSAPKPSFPVYNSQFEKAVDAQVDEFDKILGKDIDFSNWVHPQYANGDDEHEEDNQSDDERGPGAVDMSQTGYSAHTSLQGGFGQNGSDYGYGRAYEYDDSH